MAVCSNTYKDSKKYSYNNRNDLILILFLFFVIACSFILNIRDNYTYIKLPGLDFNIPSTCLFKNITGKTAPAAA